MGFCDLLLDSTKHSSQLPNGVGEVLHFGHTQRLHSIPCKVLLVPPCHIPFEVGSRLSGREACHIEREAVLHIGL